MIEGIRENGSEAAEFVIRKVRSYLYKLPTGKCDPSNVLLFFSIKGTPSQLIYLVFMIMARRML